MNIHSISLCNSWHGPFLLLIRRFFIGTWFNLSPSEYNTVFFLKLKCSINFCSLATIHRSQTLKYSIPFHLRIYNQLGRIKGMFTSVDSGIGVAAVNMYCAACCMFHDSGGEYNDSTVRFIRLVSFICNSDKIGSFTLTDTSSSGYKNNVIQFIFF